MTSNSEPRDPKAILVVEDDQAVRYLLTESLSETEGWSVTAVEDGAKALAVLDTIRPDLVILDVRLPGMDGFEVYRLIRERADMAEVPVLFASAERRPRADKLVGPFQWLRKPFDLAGLDAAVTDLLGTTKTPKT